jgi:hypothetical protein
MAAAKRMSSVRLMADETAERIATLGGSPSGTPGALVAARSWDDYSLGRDGALAHLGALDLVYAGVIEAHRKAIATTEDLDPVTQDMLIAQGWAAGAVPVVRPGPSRGPQRVSRHHRGQDRAAGRRPRPQEVGPVQRPGS